VTAFIGDLTKQDSLFVIVATPRTPVKRRVTGSGWQVDVVTHSQTVPTITTNEACVVGFEGQAGTGILGCQELIGVILSCRLCRTRYDENGLEL
jgi:hypothetical protein